MSAIATLPPESGRAGGGEIAQGRHHRETPSCRHQPAAEDVAGVVVVEDHSGAADRYGQERAEHDRGRSPAARHDERSPTFLLLQGSDHSSDPE
jgi:hypothetical protein